MVCAATKPTAGPGKTPSPASHLWQKLTAGGFLPESQDLMSREKDLKLEQPHLVGDVPAHGREVGLEDLQRSLPTQTTPLSL